MFIEMQNLNSMAEGFVKNFPTALFGYDITPEDWNKFMTVSLQNEMDGKLVFEKPITRGFTKNGRKSVVWIVVTFRISINRF